MIDPSNPEYKATKRIKKGQTALSKELAALAEWIADQFDCSVPLNIVFDRTFLGDPRLQIIFEFAADTNKFVSNDGNYDSKKQLIVLNQYKNLFPARWYNRRKYDRMFAVFCSFESVARQEANQAMSEVQITAIKRAIASPILWTIKPLFESVTFLLYTDHQLKMIEGTNFHQQCLEAYSRELAQHDEFGYFTENPIHTRFSSKETFERDYEGSWFYFFR